MTDSSIVPIKAFADNYIWCLKHGAEAVVVDPGDAEPVISYLRSQGLQLSAILVTHHHPDHVGGLEGLLAAFPGIPVYGPNNGCRLINCRVVEGNRLSVAGREFDVIEVPGHTLDHIAYYAPQGPGAPVLFCGDTLFAGGCGRIFEGTPPQMQASLAKLASLPGATAVYCAHEYTLANLAFAMAAEPGNAALHARLADAETSRKKGLPTVPSTVELELKTNPFLRADSREIRETVSVHAKLENPSEARVFAELRQWKNNY